MDRLSPDRGPPGPLMSRNKRRAWKPAVRLERRLWAALIAALLSAIAFLWATPFLWTLVASFRPGYFGVLRRSN